MNYRSDIQGLRAVAVLAVIIFHFNPSWLPGGFVGVDIFLVISGFLIGSILFTDRNKPDYSTFNSLKHFYISRFKRIVPAYLIMLVLVSFVAAVLFVPNDFATYRSSLSKAFWFNANNFFAKFGDYFAPASYELPLLHTWSLAVEIQFYLIAPIIFLFLPRKILYWLLPFFSLLLTTYSEHKLSNGVHQATYYSFLSRLPAFLMGGWIALIVGNQSKYEIKKKYSNWIGFFVVVLILCSFFVPRPTGYYPGFSALLPVLAIILFIWAGSENLVSKFLSAKILIAVGALSYSLYLWHWPVLAFIRYYTGEEMLGLWHSLVFVFLTIALSSISYYCIEGPLRKRFSKRLLVGYLGLLFLVVITTLGIKKTNSYFTMNSMPLEYSRYADPSKICHGHIVADCLQGDLNSSKEILVLGDSHAAMLNKFFDYLGKELGFKARIITASSCVTIPGFDYSRIPEWAQEKCINQIDVAKKYLKEANLIFVAASWHWQLPSDDFRSALNSFLDENNKKDVNIYIFEQEPLLAMNPLRAIRFNSLGLNPVVDVDPAYHQANNTLKSLIKDYSNVESINFESTGFFKNAPFYKEVPIYYDEHHLNEVGAKYYAIAAVDFFRKIFD